MKINVNDFGIYAADTSDTVWKLRELLEKYRRQENVCLYFPSGMYHFYPDYAEELLLFIPNHDEDTIKRVAFNLTGYKKLQICGEQTKFVFHTDIVPFLVRDCEEICIEGISVDYARPGYSQGIIRKVEPRRMVIEVDAEEFPWYIRGDRVYFYGENYCRELERWIEVDAETNAPAYGLADSAYNMADEGVEAHYKKIGENLLELTLGERAESFSEASKEGNYLILRHHPRNCPAFFLEESSDIQIRNVEIYHSLAMGVIAFCTRNITLEEVKICRHPEKQHIFTVEADGFHFALCGGFVKIRKCLVENQLDDPVNIHGIYGRIKEVLEDGSFLAELVHHQHKGVIQLKSGEAFRIVDNGTMLLFAQGRAKRVERWNKDYYRVWPENEISGVKPGFALENMGWMPEVEISECTFRNNRARGILCTTGNRAVIRKNYFHVPGAAVLIAGDANFWFESGAAGEVFVEDNIFDQCAYITEWGKAPIQVEPNTENFEENRAYHGRLEVRNNRFYVSDERLFNGMNLRKLVWENNIVKKEEVFPMREGEAFVMEHVLNVKKS